MELININTGQGQVNSMMKHNIIKIINLNRSQQKDQKIVAIATLQKLLNFKELQLTMQNLVQRKQITLSPLKTTHTNEGKYHFKVKLRITHNLNLMKYSQLLHGAMVAITVGMAVNVSMCLKEEEDLKEKAIIKQ